MPAPNINKLYSKLDDIKGKLTDIMSLCNDVVKEAENYQGEIARVISGQMKEFFIPNIKKYIDDANTPGAIAPIISFLDSIPLSMARPALGESVRKFREEDEDLVKQRSYAQAVQAAIDNSGNKLSPSEAAKQVAKANADRNKQSTMVAGGVEHPDTDAENPKTLEDAYNSYVKALVFKAEDGSSGGEMKESLKLGKLDIPLGLGISCQKKTLNEIAMGDDVAVKSEFSGDIGRFSGRVVDVRGNQATVTKNGKSKTIDVSKLRTLRKDATRGSMVPKKKDDLEKKTENVISDFFSMMERDMEIFKKPDGGWGKKAIGLEKGPTSDELDQKKIAAVITFLNANSNDPAIAAIRDGLSEENNQADFVCKNPADGKGYGTVIITLDNNGKQYVANFDQNGNVLTIK